MPVKRVIYSGIPAYIYYLSRDKKRGPEEGPLKLAPMLRKNLTNNRGGTDYLIASYMPIMKIHVKQYVMKFDFKPYTCATHQYCIIST